MRSCCCNILTSVRNSGLDLIIDRVVSGQGRNCWPVPDPSHCQVGLDRVQLASVFFKKKILINRVGSSFFGFWVKKFDPWLTRHMVGSGFFRISWIRFVESSGP